MSALRADDDEAAIDDAKRRYMSMLAAINEAVKGGVDPALIEACLRFARASQAVNQAVAHKQATANAALLATRACNEAEHALEDARRGVEAATASAVVSVVAGNGVAPRYYGG